MADIDSEDSFVVITESNHAPSVRSFDNWSEISVPSHRSKSGNPSKNAQTDDCEFGVFTGTYLQNSSTFPNFAGNNNADKGYYLIGHRASDEQFSTNPTSNQNTDTKITKNTVQNAIESISSVGSRVPFSWAEITKIQPQFHTDLKGKVFDQTPKIRTIYTIDKDKSKAKGNNKSKSEKVTIITENSCFDDVMPSIPESNPYSTKSDLGRRVRRAGKRGSRLKYPNGKRGSKRNKKKKSQK